MADPILARVHITGNHIDHLAYFHLIGYRGLDRNAKVDITDNWIFEELPASADLAAIIKPSKK
jgi:hypothetical protein